MNTAHNLSNDHPLRYCLYARKSMEAEERQALLIDSQTSEMWKIAERDGLHVVVTKTEAHSAKDSGERKVFNEMIAGLKRGTYDAILTWAPDRLSRNAGDLGRLVDLMDSGQLQDIRTYSQAFTNSPNDKFLLMILCSQAKLENDNRGINVRRGLKTRVEMGLWPCSDVPTGYKKSRLIDERSKVFIDRERAPIIKQIFEKIAYEDCTTYDIYYWLKEIGFSTSRSSSPTISTVQAILHRHFYYGHFEFPRRSGKWYKGTYTPIITKELFDIVQKKLARRSYPPRKVRGSTDFMFNHLMRCGHCGSGITGQETRKHFKKRDVTYIYYSCSRGKDRRCKALYPNERDILPQLANLIDKVDIDFIGMQEKLVKGLKVKDVLFGDGKTKSSEEREKELRAYAKYIFEEGTIEEKREILSCLKSKIILTDKTVSVDTSILKNEQEKPTVRSIPFSMLTANRGLPFTLLNTGTIGKHGGESRDITGGGTIIFKTSNKSRRNGTLWKHSFYASNLRGVALSLFVEWLYQEIEGVASSIKELKIGSRVVPVDHSEMKTAFEKTIAGVRKK